MDWQEGVVTTDGGSVVKVDYSDAKSPTHGIVRGLAVLKDVPRIDIAPLYEQIQTEAVNELLRHAQSSDCYVGVEFTVGEHTITVNNDDQILIYEGDPVTAGIDDA